MKEHWISETLEEDIFTKKYESRLYEQWQVLMSVTHRMDEGRHTELCQRGFCVVRGNLVRRQGRRGRDLWPSEAESSIATADQAAPA